MSCAPTTDPKFSNPFATAVFVGKFDPQGISMIRAEKHFFESAGQWFFEHDFCQFTWFTVGHGRSSLPDESGVASFQMVVARRPRSVRRKDCLRRLRVRRATTVFPFLFS